VEPLLILGNRKAGTLARHAPPGAPSTLEACAREAGFAPEVVFTHSSAHLRQELRQRALGTERKVAIAGGDGTLHVAAQVLAESGVRLGIIPLGTANNFATALGIPTDLRAAFQVIACGTPLGIDLGVAEGEYFTEGAGVGVFAELLVVTGSQHGPQAMLRTLRALLRMFLVNRPQRLRLTIDGEPHVQDALTVTVANTAYVGYNFPIAPCARVTDGELDVVIIDPLLRREYAAYYRAIRAQAHLELPKVRVVRAREVRIEAARRAPVHVDDRPFKRTPVTVRVAPGALQVMVEPGQMPAPSQTPPPEGERG
jgi:diacylglycerol kinase (ATP)